MSGMNELESFKSFMGVKEGEKTKYTYEAGWLGERKVTGTTTDKDGKVSQVVTQSFDGLRRQFLSLSYGQNGLKNEQIVELGQKITKLDSDSVNGLSLYSFFIESIRSLFSFFSYALGISLEVLVDKRIETATIDQTPNLIGAGFVRQGSNLQRQVEKQKERDARVKALDEKYRERDQAAIAARELDRKK